MAEKTSGRNYRYNIKKPKKKSTSHWFRNLFLISLAGGSFMLFSYLGYLDYNVRKQFEGDRWAIPARVYASPVELYAGFALTAENFEALLIMLHYRQDPALSAEGTYFKNASQISVKTRAF